MDKTTLAKIYQPMMGQPSIRLPYCPICGRTSPLEQHHIVKRSQGRMFVDGRELKKPTITLCGFGNNLKDADGNLCCHGKAHHGMLHFRWVYATAPSGTVGELPYPPIGAGHWEHLETDEPVRYSQALEMEGWKSI